MVQVHVRVDVDQPEDRALGAKPVSLLGQKTRPTRPSGDNSEILKIQLELY